MGTRASTRTSGRRSDTAAGGVAWDEFERAWQDLREALGAPGALLVVEGEQDRRSVRALGVRAPVQLVHHGERLPEVAEGISREAQVAILLTDWDAAGGRLARRLADLLQDGRVTVDLDHRRRIAHAVRGELVHVEGLHRWAERRLADTNRTVDEWLRATDPGTPADQ